MHTPVVQRWREGRASYRPAGETIRTADYEIALIPRGKGADNAVKPFVKRHHYSRSYVAARYRIAMYRAKTAELVGVAIFSQGVNNKTMRVLPGAASESVELGRLVLLDDVEANGETLFLGVCFDILRREGLVGVVSFSDPIPRVADDGTRRSPGHVGTIYQAHNALYLGRATKRTLRIFPDGIVLNDRSLQKVRKGEQGGGEEDHVVQDLVRRGAAPLTGDPLLWVQTWVPRLTRPFRHPGNHEYIWGLDRRVKRALPRHLASLGIDIARCGPRSYPKIDPRRTAA